MNKDEDLGFPCVLIRCRASRGALYVWLENAWDEDVAGNEAAGRTLIARGPSKTCQALRDLMKQQEKENAN